MKDKDKAKAIAVSAVFFSVLLLGLLGTIFTSGKSLAWNVLKNSDAYRTDESINGYVRGYINAYEDAFNENVFLKERYIDLFGLVQRIMGKDVIPSGGFTGTIVRGSDNKLYSASSITLSNDSGGTNDDVKTYAEALIDLKSTLEQSGTDLLYVQAPQKYHADVEVPIPIDAQGLRKRTAAFLDYLDGNVNYIDLAERIEAESLDYDRLFFATDHHWNVDTAFWSFQEICRYLNDTYNYGIDEAYYDSDSWTRTVLEKSYLGSTGVRVGGYYVGKDDFSLYAPKFDTNFIRNYASNRMVSYSGDFAHALLSDYDALLTGDVRNLTWGVYTGSDSPWVEIQNLNNQAGKRILVVKDSFALPVCAFLSTTCAELDIYDLRYHHDTSLTEHITENKYDLVLFLYNPEALSKTFFSFG